MAKFEKTSFESSDEIYAHYQLSLDNERSTLVKLSGNWRKVAFLRGGMFLLSIVPLGLAARHAFGISFGWLFLSGLIFFGFLVVAFFHERMSRGIRIARLLVRMHEESVARMDRKLEGIYLPRYKMSDAIVPVSADLDLFGEQSLFQLLATPRTPFGVKILGDWIAMGTDVDEIKARQIAVAELKNQDPWREDFRLRCEQLASSQAGPSRFVDWAESGSWIARHLPVLWFCRLTALTTIVSIALLLVGVLPLTITGPIVITTVALNFFVSVFFAGAIHDLFNQISSHRDEISHYESLFNEVIAFDSESSFLKDIQSELTQGEFDIRSQIRSLSLLNWLANIRRNGVFYIIYILFELLFMWDIHILVLLENWKAKTGHRVRCWFEALGRWEAILALSKLAHDNPEWTFPTVKPPDDGNALVTCVQLGHPLMDRTRVANDVEVGPPGTVLLVSGSNMSGKSTLLRSLGVNAVLAQMGSVVCAESMSMPPLQIESSMRIVDSLATGTSFFMAELKRLKEIVDQASQAASDQNKTLFFLLDEILQGTNSRERQIAVARVVESLIDSGAIGAISTHDLELATTKELQDACVPVHFTEQFIDVDGKKKMTFDYRMRKGIAETTNALKLLELVGLADSN